MIAILSSKKGVGRTADDGKVFGSEVAKHPLPPRWHQEGEDDDDYDDDDDDYVDYVNYVDYVDYDDDDVIFYDDSQANTTKKLRLIFDGR